MNDYSYLEQEESMGLSRSFSVLMRNVYTWMALGLLMTALTSLIVVRDENPSFAFASICNAAVVNGTGFAFVPSASSTSSTI